jgi:aspartate carbamoyltransferase regulatory subunit
MNDKQYKVFRIDNGTVIDHIVPTMALKIINILGIKDQGLVSIGINFDSSKVGKKDIIKYENVYLDKKETDLIALFSPHATINIIKDNKVLEKRKIEMPKIIESIIRCPNPTCVTNNYRDCDTRFVVERFDDNSTVVRCFYCEKETLVLPELIR